MKKELLKKNKNDLSKKLEEKIVTLQSVRFGIAGSKSKNVKEQKMLKKDIARIKTLLRITPNQ